MTLRIGAAYHFLFFVISIVFEVKEMMMEKKAISKTIFMTSLFCL